MSDRLLDTREAAEHLRLHFGTLNKWRHTGRGPAFIRVGRKVFYQMMDLDRWLESQKQEPTVARPAAEADDARRCAG